MLFSFLGKAEGGKELCSGGETLLKGGGGGGNPRVPPPLYASLSFIYSMRKVFLEKAVLEPVYKFEEKSYRECLKR